MNEKAMLRNRLPKRFSWNLEQAIATELEADECVRWTGRPDFAEMLRDQALRLAMGFSFVAFAVIELSRQRLGFSTASLDFGARLVLMLFACAGFVPLVAGLWRVLAVRRTAYAITDRRLLIITDLIKREIHQTVPANINVVECVERRNGFGSVVFRREIMKRADDAGFKEWKFIGVQDPVRIAQKIRILESLK